MKISLKVLPFTLLLFFIVLSGCKKDEEILVFHEETEEPYTPQISTGNGVTDIDGNEYGSVIIGGQEWMTQNLRASHFANGSPIPLVTEDENWTALSSAARSEYANDPQHTAVFGLYYNAFAVHDAQGLCPDGWRVPDSTDFNKLKKHLDPNANHFHDKAGGMLKTTGNMTHGTGLWHLPNTGASNISGFYAEPSGFRGNGGVFGGMGINSNFWIVDPAFSEATEELLVQRLYSMHENMWTITTSAKSGICVRCVKN
jgi:uncharacterized protein (TIGR02145 family)